MTITIGKLAREFGLSRSTLLYYDRLGLLEPSGRSASNYRHYTDADRERLARIMTFRETGLSLKAIGELLDGEENRGRVAMLEARLERLNEEIGELRRQQQITLELLGCEGIGRPSRSMSKQQWVNLLASSGMSDEDMMEWHRQFEARMPEAHQDFLESLNISANEIRAIRKRSAG